MFMYLSTVSILGRACKRQALLYNLIELFMSGSIVSNKLVSYTCYHTSTSQNAYAMLHESYCLYCRSSISPTCKKLHY